MTPAEAHSTLEDARRMIERIAELNRINR